MTLMEALVLLLLFAIYIAVSVMYKAGRDPVTVDTKRYAYGLKLVRMKDWREGLAYFNRILEENPRSAVAWVAFAQCHAALGQHYEALTACNRALALDYNYGIAYLEKAKNLTALDDYELAFHEAEKAVWHMRDNPLAYTMRGKVFRALGNEVKALADFQKAYDLGDEDATYLIAETSIYS